MGEGGGRGGKGGRRAERGKEAKERGGSGEGDAVSTERVGVAPPLFVLPSAEGKAAQTKAHAYLVCVVGCLREIR